MRGVFLDCSNSWSINAPAELLDSNLILELGPIDERFEIRDLVRDLLSDGFVTPAEDVLHISVGGGLQEPSAADSEEERSNNIYLSAVSPIERTEFSNATIAQDLVGYSLFYHQPAGIALLLQRTSTLLGDHMGLSKTRQAGIAAHTNAAGRPILVLTLFSLLINGSGRCWRYTSTRRLPGRSITSSWSTKPIS